MKSIKTKLLLILIACTFIFLGYYRDFIFKNINALLKAHDYEMSYSMPCSLQFLENYSPAVLMKTKWILTVLFSGIYLLIDIAAIQLLFRNKKYIRITVVVYIVIMMVSLVFMGIGAVFKDSSETMYEFARYLMGMAQSPLVLMILIPAFKLSEKEKIISGD